MSRSVYFLGRPVVLNGVRVAVDRLGSVRANLNGERFSYYPYGEERTWTPDRREKFATYIRDGIGTALGLDYADQRYYSNATGSFTTPDPLGLRGAVPGNPTTWNRFAYANGDPINFYDPPGTNVFNPDAPIDPWIGYQAGGFWFSYGWTERGWGINGGGGVPGNLGGPTDPQGAGSAASARSNWDFMSAALKQAIADLAKPDCGDVVFAGGIASGHDPAEVLQAIVNGTSYGSISFKDLGAGTGGEENSRFRLPFQSKKVTITINSYNDAGGIYWNGGDSGVNAITLLHELGHAFNDLFGNGSSTIENDVNWRGKMNMDAEDRNAKRLAPCQK
jgi:RHS repeat-associated protein